MLKKQKERKVLLPTNFLVFVHLEMKKTCKMCCYETKTIHARLISSLYKLFRRCVYNMEMISDSHCVALLLSKIYQTS